MKTLLHSRNNFDWLHTILIVCGLIAFFIWFISNLKHGEIVQKNGGLGWDGIGYAFLARVNAYILFKKHALNGYIIQRILPSTFVYYFTRWLSYDIQTNIGVITAFKVYNFILVCLSVFLFWRITKLLGWSREVSVVGFASIFLSYPILKCANYFPLATDVSAFFFAVLILYCYLSGRIILFLLAVFGGAFTWPTILVSSLPLICFPINRDKKVFTTNNIVGEKFKYFVTAIFALIVTIYVVMAITNNTFPLGVNDVNPINKHLLAFSAIGLFSYIYFSLCNFLDLNYIWRQLRQKIYIWRIMVAAVLFVAVEMLIHHFVSTSVLSPLIFKQYLKLILRAALVNPLANMVAHAMYFGPMVFLLIILWKDVVTMVKEKGIGLFLFFIFYLLLAVGPESREIINAGPFFAIVACEVLNRKKVSWRFSYLFVIVSLVISRFWLKLNLWPWNDELLKFPAQMVFMGSGPWMNNLMYLVFLMVSLLVAVAIYSMLKVEEQRNLLIEADIIGKK